MTTGLLTTISQIDRLMHTKAGVLGVDVKYVKFVTDYVETGMVC